jgi:glycogen debranching enzyme
MRSSSPTESSLAGRSRRARFRATSTTRGGVAPGWPARFGATRASPSGSSAKLTPCADAFSATSGCPSDGDKRQVDSLSSNIGHLLWSGLLDDATAGLTAQRLLGDELFSGWGVRTLGASEGGYNPLGYHTGTVWPHDTSLIATGLARYGHNEAAAELASAVLSAAPFFEHRLPEVFAGFPASLTSVPVAYPTASRPQAWAAGAPLLALSTLLGLRPGVAEATLELPTSLGEASLRWQ